MNTNGTHYMERIVKLNRYCAASAAEAEEQKKNRARLKALRVQNTKKAQDMVRQTLRNTLYMTENSEVAQELTCQLEVIYKGHPTPCHMISLALSYLQEKGVDVETGIWVCCINRLKKSVNILTDPNQYY